MIIDLRKIIRAGKTEEEFSFSYTPDETLISIPSSTLKGTIAVSGKVYITGNHSAFLEGDAKMTLVGECTRCLSSAENTYTFSFEENVDRDVEFSYPLKNDTIELDKIIDDLILTNMPVTFLCKEDCKGLCTRCGANLNEGACKCEK